MSVSINRKDFKRREPKSAMQKRLRYYYKGGRQLYRDVSLLKSMINTELKFKDQLAGAISIGNTSATATYVLINGLSRGSTASQRDGNSIKVSSVQMHLRCNLNVTGVSANTLENNTIRFCLVLDKSPQTLAPTVSGGTPQSIFLSDVTYSFRDLNNRSKFTILKEWRVNLTADGRDSATIKYYKKFKNLHTIYNASTNGDITDINSNALWLIVYGSSGLVTAPNDTVLNYGIRMRYYDN